MRICGFLAVTIMLAAGILTLAACRETASTLEDINWVLVQYGEPGNMKTALPDKEVTAFFNSRQKKVSGSGGCNTYSGNYKTNYSNLTIRGSITITKMFCGGDIGTQEAAFINALQSADSFKLEQGKLIIYSGDKRLYFENTGSALKPPSQ